MRARSMAILVPILGLTVLSCAGRREMAVSPTLASAGDTALRAPESRWVTAQGGLTLRDGPGREAVSRGVIPYAGEVLLLEEVDPIVTIEGVAGRWARVRWQGREAWVFGGYLSSSMPTTGGPVPTERFVWGDDTIGYYALSYPVRGWSATIGSLYGLSLTLARRTAVVAVPTPGMGIDETVEVTRGRRRIGPGGGIAVERLEYRVGGLLAMVQYRTPDGGLNLALGATTAEMLGKDDVAAFETIAATVTRVGAVEAREAMRGIRAIPAP